MTLYDQNHFLVVNPLLRYAIGDRTAGLQQQPDGSLDVTIAAQPPAQKSNWLPAPTGSFSLILRAYIPGAAVLDQSWFPPAVQRVN